MPSLERGFGPVLFSEVNMIKLKVSMSGTDVNGKPFSCAPGEKVSLDEKSEKNLIEKDMAEPARTVKKAAKK